MMDNYVCKGVIPMSPEVVTPAPAPVPSRLIDDNGNFLIDDNGNFLVADPL